MHELCEDEDQSEKKDLVVPNLFYNLEKDQNDDYAECNTFNFEDTKQMTKVLEDVKKPEAHAHFFARL